MFGVINVRIRIRRSGCGLGSVFWDTVGLSVTELVLGLEIRVMVRL